MELYQNRREVVDYVTFFGRHTRISDRVYKLRSEATPESDVRVIIVFHNMRSCRRNSNSLVISLLVDRMLL